MILKTQKGWVKTTEGRLQLLFQQGKVDPALKCVVIAPTYELLTVEEAIKKGKYDSAGATKVPAKKREPAAKKLTQGVSRKKKPPRKKCIHASNEYSNAEEIDSFDDVEEIDSFDDVEEIDSFDDVEEIDSFDDVEEIDSFDDVEEIM